MELYMVCVLIAIALAMVIIKGIQFAMSITHPLPDKELKWRRSPTLPSHDLKPAKPKKSTKDRKIWKKRQEKEPLAHAEIPLESVSIEEESIEISPIRNSEGDSRATMV